MPAFRKLYSSIEFKTKINQSLFYWFLLFTIFGCWQLESGEAVGKRISDVIFIIRMMSELNTGSKRENSSLDSTQAFILKRAVSKEVAIDNMI
jgi:hypothetical protein